MRIAGQRIPVREARLEAALLATVAQVSKEHRRSTMKAAAWKVATATNLKETTDVSNGWLAGKLDMGTGFHASKHIGLLRKKSAIKM